MLTIPVMIIAALWMLLLGWGFHALLRRHLKLDDELSERESQLSYERHARSSAERALASTHVSLCKMARQQESVREAERQRIGRDIHDDLGQHLLALKIDLSLLQVSTSGAHPLINQKLGAMIGNLDRTIVSLRAVINDLRPLALAAGLPAAIEWQLSELTRMHGIAHVLQVEPRCFDGSADAERDATVFRILQESLSNVVRHAHATEVTVALSRCANVLTMTVRDNGVGMPLPRGTGGNGLPGIGERAAAIGGRFSIDSQPGSGTLLTLSFPLIQSCALH
ncbi:MAG TPA: sensor histidine kinase [Telluria sp.]|jgi:signal transduction histidine kinase